MMRWIKNFFFTIWKILTSRVFIIVLLLAFQFSVLYYLLDYLNNYTIYFHIGFEVVGVLLVIYIFNQEGSPSVKMSFIMLITVIPLFGIPFYLIWENNDIHKKYIKILRDARTEAQDYHLQDPKTFDKLQETDRKRSQEARYIYRATGMPVYENTKIQYHPSGEDVYQYFLEAIRHAEKFIFVEFFIIKKGSMWSEVLDILKKKASEGVEVRLMYDDIGCSGSLPLGYNRELEKSGIRCTVFNPFNPRLTINHNYRDHRKICVIDGKIGITGGFNLSDEYINRVQPYGYWKDSAVSLEGEAVWNMTVMFLENWDFAAKAKTSIMDYSPKEKFPVIDEGFVAPFSENPLDRQLVGESVYMDIVSDAVDYVWFSTPYLVIDHEFQTALELAARRGVDVRIVTPGIPDNKRITYFVTRSYYPELIRAGVKIYEYTPGFVHAKNCISDDKVMTCGTINLDYRSFYHHFENGVWAYGTRAAADMKKDFLGMMEKSREITLDWLQKRPLWQRLVAYVMKMFAPVL